jgi:hypothetical protein
MKVFDITYNISRIRKLAVLIAASIIQNSGKPEEEVTT